MAGKDDDIALVIERWFDAPRDLVWRAYTDMEHLSRWWGPPNSEWIKGSLDLKPGGIFHYGVRMPNGGAMWGKFVYREIAAPKKLAFVNAFSDEHGGTTPNPWMPDWPLEVLNTITFREENGRTLVTMHGMPIDASDKQLELYKTARPQMQAGFKGANDKLAAYLAQLQQL